MTDRGACLGLHNPTNWHFFGQPARVRMNSHCMLEIMARKDERGQYTQALHGNRPERGIGDRGRRVGNDEPRRDDPADYGSGQGHSVLIDGRTQTASLLARPRILTRARAGSDARLRGKRCKHPAVRGRLSARYSSPPVFERQDEAR